MNYYSLDKNDRKKIRDKYYSTKKGNGLNNIFTRLVIEGVVCLGLGIYFLISYNYLNGGKLDFYLSIISFIAGVFFLIGQWCVRIREYDKFLLKGNK